MIEYEYKHEKMLKEAEKIIQKSIDNGVKVWVRNEDGQQFVIDSGFSIKSIKIEKLNKMTAEKIIDLVMD